MQRNRRLFVLCTMLALLPIAGTWIALGSGDRQTTRELQTTEDLQVTAQRNTAFGIDLYQALKNTDGNLFFSPYSISTALAMTYAGAAGQTAREMAAVLQFPSEQAELHAAFQTLQTHLDETGQTDHCRIDIANALWCQQGDRFLDSFLDLTRQYYGAGVRFVDFQTINTWVEDRTRQKIKELIRPGVLDPATALVLSNAIYFKGEWISRFDEQLTSNAEFFVTPHVAVPVPMMTQKADFVWKQYPTLTALELGYEGGDCSLVVLLPSAVDGIDDLEASLTADMITTTLRELAGMHPRKTVVQLPKFTTTCEFELNQILAALGMPSAFRRGSADFSGMNGDRDLFISNVVHKAFVEVNEEGTEAAAATAVVMKRTSVEETHHISVNHPFVFLIKDNTSGSMLFLGRVVDPTQ